MMEKCTAYKLALVGAMIVFWLVLDALFGYRNVRIGLRVFVLIMVVLGIVMAVADKIRQRR